MCGKAWGFSKICAGLLREGTLEGSGKIPDKMQVRGGGSTEAHRVGCVVSKLGGECCILLVTASVGVSMLGSKEWTVLASSFVLGEVCQRFLFLQRML